MAIKICVPVPSSLNDYLEVCSWIEEQRFYMYIVPSLFSCRLVSLSFVSFYIKWYSMSEIDHLQSAVYEAANTPFVLTWLENLLMLSFQQFEYGNLSKESVSFLFNLLHFHSQ